MLNEQSGNSINVTEDLSREITTSGYREEIVNAGTSLILALEDIIESLESTSFSNRKNGIVSGYQTNRDISLNDIKNKAIKIKNLFNSFQVKIKINNYARELKESDIDCFLIQVENYVDEILTDWLLISESDKAIDRTHGICYKIRELLRKI
jgi:hypothetical protein